MAESTVPVTTESNVPVERERTRPPEHFVAPPVDIYETEEGLVVVADLPGVTDEDLDVRVDNGILTIQANPKHALEVEPDYREYQLVRFFRQFELPEQVDQQKIAGEMKNGVLKLTLPKAEKAKPRQIKIDVG